MSSQRHSLAKLLNISAKGKRLHRIWLHAQALCIKHDDDINYQSLLNIVRQLDKGWSKNLANCPPVGLVEVTTYLLKSHECVTGSSTTPLTIWNDTTLSVRIIGINLDMSIQCLSFLSKRNTNTVHYAPNVTHHGTLVSQCMNVLLLWTYTQVHL